MPPSQGMRTGSKLLRFHHGVIPSCLGETLVLALEGRAEALSLGRNLSLDSTQSIGARARVHGFDFTRMYSFGNPLDDAASTQFRRVRWRLGAGQRRRSRSPASS